MAAMKHSRQRDAVRENLMQRRDHPTADMIYEDIRKEHPNISLGTVYRNLSVLVETGDVNKLNTDSADRFDANLEPHAHFICSSCGAIVDLPPVGIESMEKEASNYVEGTIDKTNICFIGHCKKCMV
ncbi:MAG: transcriptional repressor [Eubacterium sp.]|nr:transcriptional repressor [Eubacterium sp.]